MINSMYRNKVKSIDFTLKQQPKLKKEHCRKCKKCSCIANLTLKEKELVK